MRRKKLVSLSICLLIVLSVLSILNAHMTGIAAGASSDPVVRVEPASIIEPAWGIGTTFEVSIITNYTGSDVWGYEFTLTYNPLTLNIVPPNVTNGDLVSGVYLDEFLKGTVDNTEGTLSLTGAHLKGENVTTGPGTLANVTFQVADTGDSYLTLGAETRLIGMNSSTGEEYNIIDDTDFGQIQDGYFRNTVSPPTHDVAVLSVTPNTTNVLAGESVEVTVNVQNQGTVKERFQVELSRSAFPIETKTMTLNSATSTPLSFIWDTTLAETGNYTLEAVAGPVVFETDTADNTGTSASNVILLAPSIAIDPASIIDVTLTVGEQFTVSVYTDYNGTVIGRTDLWGYELTLSYDASILNGIDVINGDLLPATNFTAGTFNNVAGTLSLTVNNNTALTSGPGILANVTFQVVGVGDCDVILGPETRLIGSGSYFNITLLHNLKHGFFTNGIDCTVDNVVASPIGGGCIHASVHGYPTWTVPIEITVTVRNLRLTETGPFDVATYYKNATGSYLIQTQTVTKGLDAGDMLTLDPFYWFLNSTDPAWGLYNITAKIVAPNDVNPLNDERVGDTVKIRIPGDIVCTANVDWVDFGDFATAYGSTSVDPNYNIWADLNLGGNVDWVDFGDFATHYGKSTAKYPSD